MRATTPNKNNNNKYKTEQVLKYPYKSSTLSFFLLAEGKISEVLKYVKRLQLLPALQHKQ